MSLTELERMLGEIDVCWAPVKTMPEALEDPQLLARGFVVRDERGRRWIASPIRFRDEPAKLRLQTHALDADAVLARRTS
jgi:crotonobetainyl-CoA:carnitine CoA-transferase CaiB-like acyl-CoA transferase